MPNKPTSSPVLRFDSGLNDDALEAVRDNVSAIVNDRDHLWLGGDEGTSIHRMTRQRSGNFGDHVTFELKDILRLPAPAEEEIDIEGLDLDGGYLWLIGSHSAKRKKTDKDRTLPENLKRLTKVELEGNRLTLARVPLDGTSTPVEKHGRLTAARLAGDVRANLLTTALQKDHHLGRFVPRAMPDGSVQGIPSKDNGFDVEGLAVTGNRVFLGLRGPVLRGWALVIELRVAEAAPGQLTLEALGAGGEPYLKHFLPLQGLGVRDLVIHGRDLLVLAGPSMDLDGPVFVYRWQGGLKQSADSIAAKKDLTTVVTVPFGVTKDHAEGLSLVTDSPPSVLVCYDSPAKSRIRGANGTGVTADIFRVRT